MRLGFWIFASHLHRQLASLPYRAIEGAGNEPARNAPARGVLVLRRFLRTLDRVSIGRDFLSLQLQPKLFLNSRNERVLRQSVERRNRARKRLWSPLQVEIVTSLQSGLVDHRRAQMHAEETDKSRHLDRLRMNLPAPSLT